MNTISHILEHLSTGADLSAHQAKEVFDLFMAGEVSPVQAGAFLLGLRAKGETADELSAAVEAALSHARLITGLSGKRIDTCGTGGDATGNFNISTATAFVVAGAGVRVAKHGNRSVSSLCGSADVVEALGIRIDIPADAVARCIDEVGIGFLYAPLLHDAMRFVVLARREMKIRTVFNLLGPICNPARATAQVLGVYNEDLTEVMAQVLCELGTERAFVVHGSDGLDEITITGESKISEVRDGEVRTYYVTPEDFGIARAPISAIQGGDAKENAVIIHEILSNRGGPRQNVVLLNAAAGLVVGGKASGLREGIQLARESIASGRALSCLERLIELTR